MCWFSWAGVGVHAFVNAHAFDGGAACCALKRHHKIHQLQRVGVLVGDRKHAAITCLYPFFNFGHFRRHGGGLIWNLVGQIGQGIGVFVQVGNQTGIGVLPYPCKVFLLQGLEGLVGKSILFCGGLRYGLFDFGAHFVGDLVARCHKWQQTAAQYQCQEWGGLESGQGWPF